MQSVALIDYGSGNLRSATNNTAKGLATIFGYYVNDPERFGVLEMNEKGQVLLICPRFMVQEQC